MLKDTPLLIIMEDSLVKVTYKQPRANNNESKVNVVVLKLVRRVGLGLGYTQVQLEATSLGVNLKVTEYWLESMTIVVIVAT
jgi:hypothetical protein